MAKKRKSRSAQDTTPTEKSRYDVEETFDDSQDEFFAGQDKILLDEAPASKRRRKLVEQEQYLQPSDEEVLAYESEQESEGSFDQQNSEQGNRSEDEGGEEDDDENWGTSKSDYYNADAIETEADALDEEAEARRLQQKQLKGMTDEDFGFDEFSWTVEEQSTSKGKPVVEKLPDVTIPPNASQQEKLKILRSRYPELQPLAQDFQDLQAVWIELQQVTRKSSGHKGISNLTKLEALSAYLGAIVMYLAILTSQSKTDADEFQITALPSAELHDHPVIGSLTRSKQLWESIRDIEIPLPVIEAVNTLKISTKVPSRTKAIQEPKIEAIKPKSPKMVNGERETKKNRLRGSKSKDEKKKKQKSARTDLETLLSQSALAHESEPSEFGDEAPLTEEQAAEKAKKKKSLRFYSSQIVQKANKRGTASREAGGDDDLPHKERLRERQERLLKEAERRGQQKATAEEELGGSDDEADGVISGDDEYYQTLVAQSKQKKADKKAKAEVYAEAARQGGQVYEEEEIGPDGKRAITYAIQKNKGLMPKRKKDVRNPRVKKRHKFEEKKKKLASIRQVYKGGEGRGGYGGELTGIKTNLVKSIKLS